LNLEYLRDRMRNSPQNTEFKGEICYKVFTGRGELRDINMKSIIINIQSAAVCRCVSVSILRLVCFLFRPWRQDGLRPLALLASGEHKNKIQMNDLEMMGGC